MKVGLVGAVLEMHHDTTGVDIEEKTGFIDFFSSPALP
jgi:hypothetical protein